MVIRRASLSILFISVLLGSLLIVTGRAEADTFSTRSSFGFYASSTDVFTGRVASNSNRCLASRLVKVFRERGRNDQLIGRDRTDAMGWWEIKVPNVPSARYYALISKQKFGPNGRNVCRKYKSSTLPFGG